ncbi:MAG: hydroxylase [Planctomycetota bacterium]
MNVQYLEIVTPDEAAVRQQYEAVHGLAFGEPDAGLGGARTAELGDGAMIGIRGPMHAGEKPVVRPYVLVEDIAAAVKAAEEAGGTVAVPPMALPGHGTCAIVIQGEIECGLWQVAADSPA